MSKKTATKRAKPAQAKPEVVKTKPERSKKTRSRPVEPEPTAVPVVEAPVVEAPVASPAEAKKREPVIDAPKPQKAKAAKVEIKEPIGTPITDDAGVPKKCSCGCGRIADSVNWDDGAPASLSCFIDGIISRKEQREAEARDAKAAKPS